MNNNNGHGGVISVKEMLTECTKVGIRSVGLSY